ERKPALEGSTETKLLDIIQEFSRLRHIGDLNDIANDFPQVFLSQQRIHKSYFCRYMLVEDYTAHRGFNQLMLQQPIIVADIYLYLDPGMQVYFAFVVGNDYLFCRVESFTFSFY